MADDNPDAEITAYFAKRSESFMRRMADAPKQDQCAEYELRFVAFLDILGFRNIMTGIAAESPKDLFFAISNSYWFWSAQDSVSIDLISDSIILTSKDSEPASFISIVGVVNALRNSFLERGFLIRGAVTFGQDFASHGIRISPALVEAYELEKHSAIVPRILCSQSAAEFVNEYVIRNGDGRNGVIGKF